MQTRVCRSVGVALGAVALTVSLALFAGPTLADAVIITENTTIDPAPGSLGVTIDACAPIVPLPDLPELGVMQAQGVISSALPAQPSIGSGAMGAFTADTNESLAGGTYEYTSYTVSNGAVVTYTGAVTIRVAGDLVLAGRIETSAPGASVTIVTGGRIEIEGLDGAPRTGVRTSGSSASIVLEGGTRVGIGVVVASDAGESPLQSEVFTDQGSVSIRAHGTRTSAARGIEAAASRIGATFGAATIESADFVSIDLCDIDTSFGSTVFRAFADSLSVTRTDVFSEIGNVLIESAAGVEFGDTTRIGATGADIVVGAFGGDVRVRANTVITATDGAAVGFSAVGDGLISVSASAAVVVDGDSGLEASGSGGIQVRAHGGNVRVETDGTFSQSHLQESKSGAIRVEASGTVSMFGQSFISAVDGMLEIRAFGGSFDQLGETYVLSTTNGIDVRTFDAISAAPPPLVTSGPNPYFSGTEVLLRSGAGGIAIETDFVEATDGDLAMFTQGDVLLRGSFTSAGGLGVLTQRGDIDGVGSAFTTIPNGDRSGDLVFESFGGSSARIDMTDASLETQEAENISGAIRLIIHALTAPAVDAFVLPKAVKIKIDQKKSEKSSLRVSGFYDTGANAVAFGGAATLTIGDREFRETLVPLGKNFGVQTDELKFKIKPSRAGSSKAKFTLLLKGDIAGIVSTDGPLTLRFQTVAADGRGTVLIENGKYKLGKRRGTLTEPTLFPFNVKATHKGDGKDKLVIKAGLATEAGPPATAPDVTLRYGENLSITVPGAEFVKKGDNFIASKPPSAPGVTKLVLNFVREKLELRAAKLALGPLPSGPTPVTLSVTVGDETKAVTVRMAPVAKLKANRY